VKTPNPSKAPWYFLGLQEMLVYYDPWMAGVVLPSMIVFGLMAIPYLDFNKAGNGYYTIEERKFAYIVFQLGFLLMWVTLIVMGTFLRGPNWNFFGPLRVLGSAQGRGPEQRGPLGIFLDPLARHGAAPASRGGVGPGEFGLDSVPRASGNPRGVGYLAVMPAVFAVVSRFFRDLYLRMGFLRYMVLTNLLLFMLMLPIKMLFRWSFNLKYFIAIPEYLLNF
jgi:hypothetical protein